MCVYICICKCKIENYWYSTNGIWNYSPMCYLWSIARVITSEYLLFTICYFRFRVDWVQSHGDCICILFLEQMIPNLTKILEGSLTKRWKYIALCVLVMLVVSADILGNKIASKFIGIKKTVNSVDVNLHFTCINVHIFHSIHSAIQL